MLVARSSQRTGDHDHPPVCCLSWVVTRHRPIDCQRWATFQRYSCHITLQNQRGTMNLVPPLCTCHQCEEQPPGQGQGQAALPAAPAAPLLPDLLYRCLALCAHTGPPQTSTASRHAGGAVSLHVRAETGAMAARITGVLLLRHGDQITKNSRSWGALCVHVRRKLREYSNAMRTRDSNPVLLAFMTNQCLMMSHQNVSSVTDMVVAFTMKC